MLYFFYGENDFAALREIKKRREIFLRTTQLANVSEVDFEEDGALGKFLEKLSSGGGFFACQFFLVVRNFSRLKITEEKKIKEVLKRRNPQDEIIFFQRGAKLTKSLLVDYLKEEAKNYYFPPLKTVEIQKWAIKEVAEKSQGEVSFGYGAVERLIFLTKENQWRIEVEIAKLINFIGCGVIKKETVDFFLESREVNGNFDLVEALGRRDKKRAMEILLNMLKNKEDAFLIFGSVISLFRNLVRVYSIVKKEKSLITPMTVQAVVQKLKMHPFLAQKTLKQLQKFSFLEIRKFYQLALFLDEEVKLGRLKMEEALVELIGRI